MARPRPVTSPSGADSPGFTGRHLLWLAGITLVAAAYRLIALDRVPPGINQDEALSAWNAWCLLHSGRAMSGEPWPIFHCRNLGDHPTMLFFYLLMPFQKLGGLSVFTTRLPIALAGVASTLLIAWLGARLARPSVGLVAAAVFAVAPWTTFIGRLGVGAGLMPLQTLLPVAAMVLAGFPITDRPGERARPVWGLVAGLTAGFAGYGFHSLRIHVPLMLAALLLVSPSGLRKFWDDAGGRRTLIALAIGFLAGFGPLAFSTATDPGMLKRWEMTRLWAPGDGPIRILALVAQRYAEHFGPGFLFVHGDTFSPFRPIGQGELGWYLLPALIGGAIACLFAFRKSRSARVLGLLVLLYPVGDLVSRNDGPHLLRSASGVAALVLFAAWGMVETLRWLRGRGVRLAAVAAVMWGLAAVGQEAVHAVRYFRDFPLVWKNQIDYQGALLEAARWLRPQLAPDDAVVCTTTGMTEPFVVMLVGLQYPPDRWFRDTKEIQPADFDRYTRVGNLYFNHEGASQAHVEAMGGNGREDRVWFVVRPNELGLTDPVHRIIGPTGEEMLWICRRTL